MSNRAWVTLATNDSYGLGALVLAHSLRRAGSTYPAVVLITPSVTDAMRDRLSAVFAEVVTVDVLDSGDAAHLALLQRPELGVTFTKLHCWKLTQFEKCVFLDADTLVVQNCDELFEREELSAAPDVGWPDCFNSGVFVFKPSQETFKNLIKFAEERGSFDGGDQGLLNAFFSDWAQGDIKKHLPFLYNVTSVAFYSYLPALKHYGQGIKIIHFIGAAKPWLQQYNWESNTVEAPEHLREFLQLWWTLFVSQIHTQLDTAMVEVEEAPTSLPPQDVFKYYTPTIDPESEFPWHHADSQSVDDEDEANNIDMSDFFDPWKYYRGNIPPRKEDSSTMTNLTTVGNLDEIRQYIWESSSYYHPQQNNQSDQQRSLSPQSHHSVPNQWQLQHTHHYSEPTHSHYHSNYHPSHVEQTHQQNYHQQESHSHVQQQHWHNEERTNQNCFQQHVNPSEQNIDITQSQVHQIHHSHDHYNQNQLQGGHTFVYDNNTYDQKNISQFDHSTFHKNDHPDDNSQTNNCIEYKHTFDDARCKTQNVAQIYQVHLDSQKPEVTHNNTNGFCDHEQISDDEEYFEELKPRHPYDGYYLKHRPTIDSRGRKICIHELPPTPSPPPASPSESPIFEETIINDIDNDQTGVAGNLARVVPGATGYHREAVDELTRRQGWEAGNIDYMGADSFANIWAKISQTLNQPRTSPPKESPPKESPPKESPPKESPPKESPPKELPPKESPPKELPPKELPPKEAPPKESPPKESPPKELSPIKDQPKDEKSKMQPDSYDVSKDDLDGAHLQSPTSDKRDIVDKNETEPVRTMDPINISDDAPKTENVPTTTEALDKLVAAVEETKKSETLVLEPSSADMPSIIGPTTEKSTDALLISNLAPGEVSAKIEPPTIAAVAAVALKSPIAPASKMLADEIASEVHADINVPAAVEVVTNVTDLLPETPAAKEPTTKLAVSTVSLITTDGMTKVETTSSEALSKVPALKAPITDSAASTPVSLINAGSTTKVETTTSETLPEASPRTPDSIEEQTKEKTEAQHSQSAAEVTPDKKSVSSTISSDSPPLANTPAKEEVPSAVPAKTEERRKPLGKLLLSPPSTADPVPTPDSELEDAASLAQSIIASELRTPTVSSPSPVTSPASPAPSPHKQEKRLSVEEPEVPTPPVTGTAPVSLAQIGVKSKGKTNTAAQIESSITEQPATADKTCPTPQTPSSIKATSAPITPSECSKKTSQNVSEPTSPAQTKLSAPAAPKSGTPADGSKKKIDKKASKESSGSGVEAPVPPPRKKEKKPKEK